MVFPNEGNEYTHQRSIQPAQFMAFQEENGASRSRNTYSPHPTRYQVPNFVWPLGHQYRMQARKEEPPCRRPSNESLQDSNEFISQITKARIRGETQAILEGRISNEHLQPVPDERGLESVSSVQLNPVSFVQDKSCHILDRPRQKQIEQIAYMNTRSQAGAEAWQCYLDRYTKGSLNLLKPQYPPAWGANFQFLSALHPPNEARRMSISTRYDNIWTHKPASERLGSLLTRSIKRFNVKYGSLSFFDNNYENFKMESGYRDKRINREISIAAHVLYSTEVLIIPDTMLDWRFEKNPLVTRKPQIRFFAGAPLISTEGEVFAVLTIFEKQPRNFTIQERKVLAECSAAMVNELDSFVEPYFRSTPLFERDSVIDGKYAYCAIDSPPRNFSTGHVESQLLPPPLNPRAKQPTPAHSPRDHFCSVYKLAGDAELTPPSSLESHINVIFNSPEGFEENEEQLQNDQEFEKTSVLSNQAVSDPLCSRAFTPGFYSSSSLTTVPLQSPRTSPLDIQNAADLASQPDLNYVTNSMSPSDKDCAEVKREMWKDNEDNLIDKCIRLHRMGARHLQMLNPIEGLTAALDDTTNSLVDLALSSAPRYGETSEGPIEWCTNFSQQYDFDLAYCTQLIPARGQKHMTEQELLSEAGLKKLILLHVGGAIPRLGFYEYLDALRSSARHFKNDQDPCPEGEYATGWMVPVTQDVNEPRLRTSGIVLGVFRGPRPDHYRRNTQEDGAAVTELSNKLRKFYVTHHPQPLTRAQTEPFSASPFLPVARTNRARNGHLEPCPFLANEAQEVTFGNQNTQQYSENHFPHTSGEGAEHTQVHTDQYPRALEQGPPMIQQGEKLKKLNKLVGIIGTGGYV